MAQQKETQSTSGERSIVRADGWLKRWWSYLHGHASSDLTAWQTSLLGRRKLTHPAEVMKQRQPVRANPRATWYR